MTNSQSTSDKITLVGFGMPQVVPGGGDTWQSAWMANDSLYVMNNDGFGIEPRNNNTDSDAFVTTYQHHAVVSMFPPSFNPEHPETVADITDGRRIVHPTSSTDFLHLHSQDIHILNEETQVLEKFSHPYSTDIYEVDGVLYHIVIYSRQVPGNWGFAYSNLTRSLDGGRTWENFRGEIDTPLSPTWEDSFFPKGWGQVTFVKYGRGGTAPDVHLAQEYVYVFAWVDTAHRADTLPSGYNMARISRDALLEWNTSSGNGNVKNQFEYLSFGLIRTEEDAKLATDDRFWVKDSSMAKPFFDEGWTTSIVYNHGLKRYFKTLFSSDSFQRPIIESTLHLYEASYPWGPWIRIHEEHMQAKADDNLAWFYMLPKFTSGDGMKMWASVSGAGTDNSHVYPDGRHGYTLQLMPVYLTCEPTHIICATGQMENGLVKRTYNRYKNNSDLQITGLGGFKIGAYLSFTVAAPAEGEYIVNFDYHTTGIIGANDASPEALTEYRKQVFPSISLYVNDKYCKQILLGRTVQVYSEWSTMSLFLKLKAGENTVTFKMNEGDNGNDIVISSLTYAKYTGSIALP
ncbi:MAG: hypothetical protein FWC73_07460 [Defluviitaleaceae bacterium]|nr:hypothetical protein [Defluviitaleaceae bacterium]